MMDTREAHSPKDQRIHVILAYCEDNIDKSKASDLLRSLLVSHDITNIVDLLEYCLSPYDLNIPDIWSPCFRKGACRYQNRHGVY